MQTFVKGKSQSVTIQTPESLLQMLQVPLATFTDDANVVNIYTAKIEIALKTIDEES